MEVNILGAPETVSAVISCGVAYSVGGAVCAWATTSAGGTCWTLSGLEGRGSRPGRLSARWGREVVRCRRGWRGAREEMGGAERTERFRRRRERDMVGTIAGWMVMQSTGSTDYRLGEVTED